MLIKSHWQYLKQKRKKTAINAEIYASVGNGVSTLAKKKSK
jgi:hypothetical protein